MDGGLSIAGACASWLGGAVGGASALWGCAFWRSGDLLSLGEGAEGGCARSRGAAAGGGDPFRLGVEVPSDLTRSLGQARRYCLEIV